MLEVVLIGLLLIAALSSGGAAAASVQMMLHGPLSVIFWIGLVLIGLAYPALTYLYTIGAKRQSVFLSISSGAAVILAGLFLRYMVVTAGVPATL
jgi:polysulfide reductase chain C